MLQHHGGARGEERGPQPAPGPAPPLHGAAPLHVPCLPLPAGTLAQVVAQVVAPWGPGAARGSALLCPGASQPCLPPRLVQRAGPTLSGTDRLRALHLNVSGDLAHDLLLSFSPDQVRGDRCHLGSHAAGWAWVRFLHLTLAVASWTCSSSSILCRAGPGLAGCTVE